MRLVRHNPMLSRTNWWAAQSTSRQRPTVSGLASSAMLQSGCVAEPPSAMLFEPPFPDVTELDEDGADTAETKDHT